MLSENSLWVADQLPTSSSITIHGVQSVVPPAGRLHCPARSLVAKAEKVLMIAETVGAATMRTEHESASHASYGFSTALFAWVPESSASTITRGERGDEGDTQR